MLEMFGGIIIMTIILIVNQNYSIVTESLMFSDLTYLFILGSLCTAGVFVWMIEIMRHMTPYSVIMAVNLEPIYSIIIALLIFSESEKMNLSFYIGSIIILGIVFLEGYIKKEQ